MVAAQLTVPQLDEFVRGGLEPATALFGGGIGLNTEDPVVGNLGVFIKRPRAGNECPLSAEGQSRTRGLGTKRPELGRKVFAGAR